MADMCIWTEPWQMHRMIGYFLGLRLIEKIHASRLPIAIKVQESPEIGIIKHKDVAILTDAGKK